MSELNSEIEQIEVSEPNSEISNTDISKLLECIDNKRYNNYNDWLRLGKLFYSLGISCNYWDAKSQTSQKYK